MTYADLHLTAEEMSRQDELWGQQDHPDIGGADGDAKAAVQLWYADDLKFTRAAEAAHRKEGKLGWDLILLEEVYEALSEPDDDKRRTELIQVAAVALQWAGAIRRRAVG